VVKRQMIPLSLAATAARSVPSCAVHACSRTWLVASRVAARPGSPQVVSRAWPGRGPAWARSVLGSPRCVPLSGTAVSWPAAVGRRSRNGTTPGTPGTRPPIRPRRTSATLASGGARRYGRWLVRKELSKACQRARAAIRIDSLSYVLAHVEDETGRGNLALSPTVDRAARAAPLVVAVGRVQWRGPIVNLQVATVEAWAMARGDEAVYSPHDDDAKEA